MAKDKISRIDILTIIIALAALITSVISIYFQFFNNSTNLSAKFTGTTTFIEDDREALNSNISFLFLNTGETEIAFISGFIFYSTDESSPKFSFSGDRSRMDDQQKKWYTKPINSKFIIEPGKIQMEEFKLNIPFSIALEYFNQNFDLSSNQKLLLNLGVGLNLIDSKGELKMITLRPSIVEFNYSNQEGNMVFTGSGSKVNPKEFKSIQNKYEIY